MITIIMPVSRPDFLKRIFVQLELLDCDRSNTNLLCYVDGSLELFQETRNLVVNSKFREKLCVYRRKGIGSVSSVHRRRERISAIHNEIKTLINKTDYVLLIEDDTLIPLDTITKFHNLAMMKKYFGFITGVQIGRWGYKHIGAWIVDDIYNINQITSIKKGQGIEEVDGAGLYCCFTTKENYIKNLFKPFENILGPDFDFGINLRRWGLKNYIDHSIHCDHLNKKETIQVFNSEVIRVRFDRDENEQFGWKQSILDEVADK